MKIVRLKLSCGHRVWAVKMFRRYLYWHAPESPYISPAGEVKK